MEDALDGEVVSTLCNRNLVAVHLPTLPPLPERRLGLRGQSWAVMVRRRSALTPFDVRYAEDIGSGRITAVT